MKEKRRKEKQSMLKKFKINLKNISFVSVLITVAIILCISGTLAYFTHAVSITNSFTIKDSHTVTYNYYVVDENDNATELQASKSKTYFDDTVITLGDDENYFINDSETYQSVTYKIDNTEYTNATYTMPSRNVTIDQYYYLKRYTITLDNQSATTAGTESVIVGYGKDIPRITVPTKDGYTFCGYYSNTDIIQMQYVAVWINGVKRISLDSRHDVLKNDWKYTTAGDKGIHIQGKIIIQDDNITKDNLTFDFNDITITPYKIDSSEGTITVYLDFDITEMMVTERYYSFDTLYRFIDINGLSQEANVEVEYLTKNGKKYYDQSGTSVWLNDITENITLYAKWEPNTYTVTYNSNNGDSLSVVQDMTYDMASTVEANTFTKAGNEFKGWNTEADGSGTSYSAGDEINNLTTESGGNVNLYAIWKAVVNEPVLKTGMIPITYSENKWVVADSTNTDNDWYDYDEKKWANICTVADDNADYRIADIGTEVPESVMTTMFVWIPRYAYSITSGYKTSNTETPAVTNAKATNNIDITFLSGTTNEEINGTEYATNYDIASYSAGDTTPKIVHPAFKYGSANLAGIWVAKFESSGTDSSGNAVGNGTSTSNSEQYAPDNTTYVKILPSVISWRIITIGESQYRSTSMANNSAAYGWTGVNTHLIKNSEWGAVAYMCYSAYGSVPMINGCGSLVSGSHWYDMYTGMGPASNSSEGWYSATNRSGHEYNTSNGMLASTTGNIYGIYDMSGGSWEQVAMYLDNGNSNLNVTGISTSDNTVKYFENYALNSTYSDLWEAYEVSAEEKSNIISVVLSNETLTLTQAQLWAKYGSTFTDASTNQAYNTARKRLTDATYENLPIGIGISEIAGSYSYYGVISTGNYDWLKEITDTSTNYGMAWNGDYTLTGHSNVPFTLRGGGGNNGGRAGVLSSSVTNGNTQNNHGFRVSLCP